MVILPVLAAVGASAGWAAGSVLAQDPARKLGAFEFTRIQLVACSALLSLLCTAFGSWSSVDWSHWPAFVSSICIGIVLGNLAMVECLRRGGPRRTELLLSLKAPLVAAMACVWLQEVPSAVDIAGAVMTLSGVCLAVAAGRDSSPAEDCVAGRLVPVILLGIAATGCQGFGFLVLKPAMAAGTEPMAASAIRLLGAALLVSLVALWPSQALRSHSDLTPRLLGRTVLPGVIGYGISSSLLLYAFAEFDAGIAAVLGSLSPVLVLPILWLRDGLAPHPRAVLGAALAVAGAAVIVIL